MNKTNSRYYTDWECLTANDCTINDLDKDLIRKSYRYGGDIRTPNGNSYPCQRY